MSPPPSYSMIRKLSLQKGVKTTGEVRELENCSYRDMTQSCVLHHSQESVTSHPGPFVLLTTLDFFF
jgi:hypothetical protein